VNGNKKSDSSDLCVFFYNLGGGSHRCRAPRGGPPGNHTRPWGVRTGRPQLTAGQGRPVCQPWLTGDKAAEQQPEAMASAGLLLSALSTHVRATRKNPKSPNTERQRLKHIRRIFDYQQCSATQLLIQEVSCSFRYRICISIVFKLESITGYQRQMLFICIFQQTFDFQAKPLGVKLLYEKNRNKRFLFSRYIFRSC